MTLKYSSPQTAIKNYKDSALLNKNKMNFNKELYREYRKAAGRQEKDGIWDVTRFPNGLYCFATKQWLGDNGKIDNHPMLGKKFKRVKDNKIFTMDSVCIHWWECGYYYYATLRDENNSHATAMIQNINSQNELILDAIQEFNQNYTLINE